MKYNIIILTLLLFVTVSCNKEEIKPTTPKVYTSVNGSWKLQINNLSSTFDIVTINNTELYTTNSTIKHNNQNYNQSIDAKIQLNTIAIDCKVVKILFNNYKFNTTFTEISAEICIFQNSLTSVNEEYYNVVLTR